MTGKSIVKGAFAAALLAATVSTVIAQGQGPGPDRGWMMGRGMGPGMMGRGGMMGGGLGMMMDGCPMMGGMMGWGATDGEPSSFAEGRIAFLSAELGIGDAQQAVWKPYADAIRKNLENMQAMHAKMWDAMSAKTPVERLDAHIAAMEGRISALKDAKPALAALYEALSDAQKKKADELLTGMGCMM